MVFVLNFNKRGTLHVHLFMWIFNPAYFENKAAYMKLIERTINTQLLDHFNDPELFELVKIYQVHAYSRTCWKYNENECMVVHLLVWSIFY